MDSLIPTFKPGQKAVLHMHPYEHRCLACGHIAFEGKSEDLLVTILGPSNSEIGCTKCGGTFAQPEGFWRISSREKGVCSVPYTLLSPLPEEK